MNKIHQISPELLTLPQLQRMAAEPFSLILSEESKRRIHHCRHYLEGRLDSTDEAIYGINTGFGSLYKVRISKEEMDDLQVNLVRSHACGAGEEVPSPIVRWMLFLKVQSLAQGYSAVSIELVERLIYFYNEDILPVVYQLGSLGASGDLAPLAHLSLPIIGEGEVYYKGQRMSGAEALRKAGLEPISLKAKEGLALLNGTQFSTAYGLWCLIEAERLLQTAHLCAALSIDAFDGHLGPFHHSLHEIRPHPGQIAAAGAIRHWLEGSEIAASPKAHVQDPYAFRCVPQVHGASADAMAYVRRCILTEANAVTDNPNIFPEENLVLSGGNFHAQPIALALDLLAIALAELGSISERRTYQLISGSRDLPAFLTPRPGLNSGLMIPQYTAASIVSQNKQLCTPASVDSIVSSNGQEDHVSMAANAATKLYRVVKNVDILLAIEWMTAAQAIEFRRPAQTSPALEDLLKKYRQKVPRLENDRILRDDFESARLFLGREAWHPIGENT